MATPKSPRNELVPPPPPSAPSLGQLGPVGNVFDLFDAAPQQQQQESDDIAKPGPYVTSLAPNEENQFADWVMSNRIPFDDSPKSDYDMRGYWKDIVRNGKDETSVSKFDGMRHFPDTYKTPYHKTFSKESKYATDKAPHWEGDKLISRDGKTVADETNPFDAFDEQQAPPTMDLGGTSLNDVGSGVPDVQAALGNGGLPAAQYPAAKLPDTKLNSLDKAALALGLDKIPEKIGAAAQGAVKGAEKLPILGDLMRGAEKAGSDVANTAKGVKQEVFDRGGTGPIEALAGAAAAIPAGVVGVPQSLLNVSNKAAEVIPPQLMQALQTTPALSVPAGLIASAKAATEKVNEIMKRDKNAPIQAREAYQNLPGIKQLIEGNPASASLGEIAGSAVYPMAGPGGPLVKGLTAGAGFGTLGNMEQQIQGGKIPDIGAAVKEGGIPGAFIGAGFGALGHIGNKGRAKGESAAQSSTPPAMPADVIQLPDGVHLSLDDALQNLDDPKTPPELKAQINEALNARDQQIAQLSTQGEAPPPPPEPAKPKADVSLMTQTEEAIYRAGKRERDIAQAKAENAAENVQETVTPSTKETPTEPAVQPEPTKTEPENVTQNVQPSDVKDLKEAMGGAGRAIADNMYRAWSDSLNKTGKLPTPEQGTRVGKAIQEAVDRGMPATAENLREFAIAVETGTERLSDALKRLTPEPPKPSVQDLLPQSSEPSAPAGPRYVLRPNTGKGGGYEIFDTHTQTVKSRPRERQDVAQARVDKLNAGEVKPTQGHGSEVAAERAKPETTEHRSQIFEAGKPIPDTVPEETRMKLGGLAEAKHAVDRAKAKFAGAYDAWKRLVGQPDETRPRPAAQYIQEIEDAAQAALKDRPDEVGLEVQNKLKYPNEEVKLPEDPIEAGRKVLELRKKLTEAETKYNATRDELVPTVKAGMESGELPSTMNVPHIRGEINIRAVPKQGSLLDQEMNAVRARNPVPTDNEVVRTIKAIKEFIKDQSGSAPTQYGLGPLSPLLDRALESKAPVDTHPAVESIAEGALQDPEINFLTDKAEAVKRVFSLRRTLDIVHDHSPELHSRIWQGIAKETILGRGIKFKPGEEHLVDKSLSMTPEEIRGGAKGLSALSAKQRNYLATRRAIRQETAKSVRAEMEKLREYYGENNMRERDKHAYKVLDQLDSALTGRAAAGDTGNFAVGRALMNAMYDYVFKWNVPYHALNLLDPLVIGSPRVGLMNIMKAKAMLQTDSTVRDFIKSHEAKGPMGELRAETRKDIGLAKGVKADLGYKVASGISKFQQMIPDLPSEAWNFQDTLAASIMSEGDRLGYKGGGAKYLKDMASGKLSLEQQVDGYVGALQKTMDITGAGSFGLDKDPIQANPGMKYVVQFASQPYRVVRLLKDWTMTGQLGKLATFAVINTLVAGRSTIPKEIETAMEYASPQTRAVLYAMQDALDSANVVAHIPVIGRDLVDKMKLDLIPVLGGTQSNLLFSQVEDIARDMQGQKWDKLGKSAFFLALSGLLGGGGVQGSRVEREGEKVAAGEEEAKAYPSYLGAGVAGQTVRPLASTTYPGYGLLDGLINSTLPGREARQSEFTKQARRDKGKPPLFGQ